MRVLFTAFLLLAASAGFAAGPTWQPLGEPGPGGPLGVLAQSPHDPSLVIAGGRAGGIWRSEDGGAAWRPSVTPIPYGVQTLLFHPRNPQRVMAGTIAGPFVSEDAGSTWQAARAGLPADDGNFFGAPIGALAFVPRSENAVLAGTGTLGTQSRMRNLGMVCRSDDWGAAWRVLDTSMGSVRGIVFAPAQPNWAVMGTARGLFQSQSGGANWARALRGLPPMGVWAVTALPGPEPRFAAAFEEAGVFVSHDGGRTWDDFNVALPPGARSLAWFPLDEGILCAALARESSGVYFRHSTETPWQAFDELAACPAPYADGLAVAGLAAGRGLLVWTARNAYSLGGQGMPWRTFATATKTRWRGNGLGLLDARAAACSPLDPAAFVLIGAHDFWLTRDGGATFGQAREGLPAGFTAAGAVFSPRDPRELFLWARRSDNASAVAVSRDGGERWRELLSVPTPRLHDLVPGTHNTSEFLALANDAVLRTVSNGATWEPVLFLPQESEGGAFSVDSSEPRFLTWGGAEGGVWKSDDGGRSWRRLIPTLPDARGRVCTTTGGELFVAAGNAVWRRGAGAWEPLKTADKPARAIALARDRVLVAIFAMGRAAHMADPGEVWYSPDLGRTWRWLREGLSGTAPAVLATGVRNPDLLILGQRDGGFFTLAWPAQE